MRGGLLYSDDHGKSWQTGAVLPDGSDEVAVVETARGDLYLSYRKNTQTTGKRHFARSTDHGATFCEHGQHQEIPDAGLHAGLIRHHSDQDENILLFSNPNPSREMTIRMSRDHGQCWPTARRLGPGLSRYSDLAVTADETILCLYTNGVARDREKISVARFNLEWLTTAHT